MRVVIATIDDIGVFPYHRIFKLQLLSVMAPLEIKWVFVPKTTYYIETAKCKVGTKYTRWHARKTMAKNLCKDFSPVSKNVYFLK